MFPRFLRRRSLCDDRTVSAGRNDPADCARLASVGRSIATELRAAEQERARLRHDLDDALACAAVTGGNGTDEYLTRDDLDRRRQNILGDTIARAERRLEVLSTSIGVLRRLNDTLSASISEVRAEMEVQPSAAPAVRTADLIDFRRMESDTRLCQHDS